MKMIVAIIRDIIKDVRGWNWAALITWTILLYIACQLFKLLLGLFK
jgi:hypothetical protein